MVDQTQNSDASSVIRSCAISQELESYPLLIQEMQKEFGDGWGGLEIDDAISVLNSSHAVHMQSVVLALGSRDEQLIDIIENIIQASRSKGIRVIIVTNDLSATGLHRLMRSGADDFVPYPLPAGALSSALKNVVVSPQSVANIEEPQPVEPASAPVVAAPESQPVAQTPAPIASEPTLIMDGNTQVEPAQTHNFAQSQRNLETQQQEPAQSQPLHLHKTADEPAPQPEAAVPPTPEPIPAPPVEVAAEIPPQPQPATPAVSALPKSGTVFPVFGAAGGVGASTFAANLAWELQSILGEEGRVCLLDFGFQFGSVGTYLDTARTDATLELFSSIEIVDEEGFNQSLSMYKDTLSILPAPPDSVPLDIMNPDQVGRLIDIASAQFDYVVIDLPNTLMSWSEMVLDRAHLMFSLLELDMRSAQNALRFLRALKSDELPYEKVQFILNRAPKMTDLSGRSRAKRMADSLNIEFRWMLPDGGKHVLNACDQGMPMALTAARNPYRKDMHKIAENLISLSAQPEPVKARA